jgi:hypothetical protein
LRVPVLAKVIVERPTSHTTSQRELIHAALIAFEGGERVSNSVEHGTPRPPATIASLEAADTHVAVPERHTKAVGLKALASMAPQPLHGKRLESFEDETSYSIAITSARSQSIASPVLTACISAGE